MASIRAKKLPLIDLAFTKMFVATLKRFSNNNLAKT